MTKLESFLSVIERLYRRHFLNLAFTYAPTNGASEECYDVLLTPVGAAHSLPSTVVSLTEKTLRVLKVSPESFQALDEEVTFNSYLMLRLSVLRALYLISAPDTKLDFFDFLTRLLNSRISGGADFMEYLLKQSANKYLRDGDRIYIYGHGSASFTDKVVSFYSTTSLQTDYQIDNETSVFNVVALLVDQLMETEDDEYPILPGENVEDEEAVDPNLDPMGMNADGSGGDFGGGDFGGGGFGGGGSTDFSGLDSAPGASGAEGADGSTEPPPEEEGYPK
jgi:hypothetical protein